LARTNPVPSPFFFPCRGSDEKNKSTAPSRTQFRVLRQICNLIPAQPFRAPHPISDFGQVLAVQVDVSFVLDQLVPELLLQVDAPLAGLRHAIDCVHHEVEAVQVVQHRHVEGGGDSPLLLVTADVDVVVVGAAITQPMDQPRLGAYLSCLRLDGF